VKQFKTLYGQELKPDSFGLERTKKEITGDFTVVGIFNP